MTIMHIYVVAYRDPIYVNFFLFFFLTPIFSCFVIVITKIHTGILIVLSMIIMLGRMLRLMKKINCIL